MSYGQVLTLLFLILSGSGLYSLRQYRGTKAWKITTIGVGGLLLLSWPPAVELTARLLAGNYTRRASLDPIAEVIVVPSGAVSQPTTIRPYILVGQDTYKRVMHAAWLFHSWRQLPILVTGGPATGQTEPASVSMRRLLQQEGVPSSMIWTEERSRSTYENALFSAKLLREHHIHHIALVVDADSMLRAEKCFRKQGFAVAPVPCWVQELHFNARDLMPGWQAIYRHEILLHEGVGLLWYWLRGWI
jgi:uncharacterized SAM-binding protein YcdF (DUF218 family)